MDDDETVELPGTYAGVGAVGNLPQLVEPGVLIGEDPDPSTTTALVFGDPYDCAVRLDGTRAELRHWLRAALTAVGED